MEIGMDPTRVSHRTLEALERLPADRRARAEAIVAQTQTAEARSQDASDGAILDREYRETGRIATVGSKVAPEDAAHFRTFIETLQANRLKRRLSLERLAAESSLDKAALSRLESGKQSNPTVATLMRYAEALGMRLTLSLEPRSDAAEASSPT
jgi:DNA-binding phage protein